MSNVWNFHSPMITSEPEGFHRKYKLTLQGNGQENAVKKTELRGELSYKELLLLDIYLQAAIDKAEINDISRTAEPGETLAAIKDLCSRAPDDPPKRLFEHIAKLCQQQVQVMEQLEK